jgi:hypothetical protein
VPAHFRDFLRYEFPVSRRDNLGFTGRLNVIDLWNIKNAAYTQLPKIAEKSIIISYENLIKNPQGFLREVGNYLLPNKHLFFWTLPSTKKDDMSFDQYRAKYDLRNIANGISASDFQFILNRVDAGLMEYFGYANHSMPARLTG